MPQSSPRAAVGLDFGTTNSSIAQVLSSPGDVSLARFNMPGGDTTASFRSVLYLERDGRGPVRSFSGPHAIKHYLAAEDEEHRGRLIQSLKSYLPARDLTGTEVFGRRYSVEDLLARILRELREEASVSLNSPVERAVVGRPVRFVGAETEEDEQFALGRLRMACEQAGFREIAFEYEPVGAAYAYAATLTKPELVLIGDFGGGTSDFSLLRFGPGIPQGERVLGTSGVGLAGDAFDAKLVRRLVSPALGAGSMERSIGGKLLPALPAWIYTNLERWHTLSFLRNRNVTNILNGAAARALEPEKIEALRTLIEGDLGFQLHAAVQQLKWRLSSESQAEFRFREHGLELSIPVTRTEFEAWIMDELNAIAGAVDTVLAKTGVQAEKIDRVFLTGGTSFVPAVERIFTERFGAERVRRGEAFTAVAYGLALRAQEIFAD